MNRLLWLDLETTGLDFSEDKILEVAWRCSTLDLSRTSPLYSRVATPTPEALDRLYGNEYVKKMHSDSGLLHAMRGSDPSVWSLARIEEEILRDMFYFDPSATWHIAGASIHYDYRMIETDMPTLHGKLHHRIFDTSSIKLLLEGLDLEVWEEVNENPHRARNDVAEVFNYTKGVRALMTSKIAEPVEGTHNG